MKTIGLNKQDYKLFIRDALNNCLITGGKCNIGCIFCSCKAQNSIGLRNQIDYISKADIDSIVDYINPNQTIFFGEGTSFLSCEPFSNTEYIDLLEYFNKYFPNSNKMTTTTGLNINPQDYDRLRKCNISFVISVNTLDQNKRQEIMKSQDNFYGLIDFLKNCKDIIHKVSLFYFDMKILKSDLEKLNKIDSDYITKKQVMLRLIDYSKFHNQKTQQLHLNAKKTWFKGVEYFDKNVMYPYYWLRSLSDFPDNVKEINNGIFGIHTARKLFKNKINEALMFFENNLIDVTKIGFLLAESVYDYFIIQFPELKKNAIFVKNNTFGGSYTVAPLLTLNDFINAILKNKKFNTFLTSKTIFNWKRDIGGNHIIFDYPFKIYLI